MEMWSFATIKYKLLSKEKILSIVVHIMWGIFFYMRQENKQLPSSYLFNGNSHPTPDLKHSLSKCSGQMEP